MSRVITFSQTFPSYHPRKGKQTHFVEKIWNSRPYCDLFNLNPGKEKETELFWETIAMNFHTIGRKYHTIRAGHRWKAGDKFSPRVWSGKPYRSKQIIFAPDIEIKKLWDIEIRPRQTYTAIYLNGNRVFELEAIHLIQQMAANDGLSYTDFLAWFKYPQPFQGQIICWDENVNY